MQICKMELCFESAFNEYIYIYSYSILNSSNDKKDHINRRRFSGWKLLPQSSELYVFAVADDSSLHVQQQQKAFRYNNM